MTWKRINKELGGPDVEKALTLVDILLALPPTSVENERGFSLMNVIKGNRRQRLSNARLNNQMRIRIEGPSISDFDPGPSVETWMVILIFNGFTIPI